MSSGLSSRGRAADILFGSPDEWAFPVDWTRDGRRIVFADIKEVGSPRIGVIDAEPGSEPEWVMEAVSHEMRTPDLSPDNRWLSYANDSSGRWEVYITSLPSGEGRWQVSNGGGVEPVWSHDGKALYYRAGGGMITRALLDLSGGAPRVSKIEPLFEVSANVLSDGTTYDVAADGGLIVTTVEESDVNVTITVVLDWK